MVVIAELFTSILDGAPFPQVTWSGSDLEWILKQRGSHIDPLID